jgi:hypothetical protein
MIRRKVCHLSIAVMALAVSFGCGDSSGLPRRYPVSGTVTYQGKPLEGGNVNFTPTDPANGRAASGAISGGQYSLTTHNPGDGALPGSYKVSIVAKEIDPSKVEVKVKTATKGGLTDAQKQAIALQFQQFSIGKAAAAAKNLIPAHYSSPETSGLTFEVKETSNTANFELKD